MLWSIYSTFSSALSDPEANYGQTSIVIAAQIFATVGFLATASRMAWAFARERGLPGASTLAKVSGDNCGRNDLC